MENEYKAETLRLSQLKEENYQLKRAKNIDEQHQEELRLEGDFDGKTSVMAEDLEESKKELK